MVDNKLKIFSFLFSISLFLFLLTNPPCMFAPVEPTKAFTPVVVEDAGKVAAAILANPATHANKTYKIISDHHSFSDVAAVFSEALGK